MMKVNFHFSTAFTCFFMTWSRIFLLMSASTDRGRDGLNQLPPTLPSGSSRYRGAQCLCAWLYPEKMCSLMGQTAHFCSDHHQATRAVANSMPIINKGEAAAPPGPRGSPMLRGGSWPLPWRDRGVPGCFCYLVSTMSTCHLLLPSSSQKHGQPGELCDPAALRTRSCRAHCSAKSAGGMRVQQRCPPRVPVSASATQPSDKHLQKKIPPRHTLLLCKQIKG